MNDSGYGLWPLVVFNSLLFVVFGAVTTRLLLRCPMCGGDDWREGVNTPR